MVIKKLFGVFAVTLMASACVSHPAQYQSLSVTLKNNEPCFAIPAKEGANKQVISSQADSLIKISRIWADFFPANTSNQPI